MSPKQVAQLRLALAELNSAVQAVQRALGNEPAQDVTDIEAAAEVRVAEFTAAAQQRGKTAARLRLRVSSPAAIGDLLTLCGARIWPSDLALRDSADSISLMLCGIHQDDIRKVAQRVTQDFHANFPQWDKVTVTPQT